MRVGQALRGPGSVTRFPNSALLWRRHRATISSCHKPTWIAPMWALRRKNMQSRDCPIPQPMDSGSSPASSRWNTSFFRSDSPRIDSCVRLAEIANRELDEVLDQLDWLPGLLQAQYRPVPGGEDQFSYWTLRVRFSPRSRASHPRSPSRKSSHGVQVRVSVVEWP